MRSSEPGPPVSQTTDFADFLSREDFGRLAAHYLTATKNGNDIDYPPRWRETYQEMLSSLVWTALTDFLKALRDEGRLGPIPGGAGRKIDFLLLWNAMVSRDPDFEAETWGWRRLSMKFAHPLAFEALYPLHESVAADNDREGLLDAAYEGFVARTNAGTIGLWQLGLNNEYDAVTDERFCVQLKAWQPRIGPTVRGSDELGALTDIERTPITEVEVTFESGELLIADWFRIPEFTETVDARDYARAGPGINSVIGREASTLRNARDWGFLSVHLGNTSPRVYSSDGLLVAGRLAWDEDGDEPETPEGIEEVAWVITDLWNATVIDRARLVGIVAGKLGASEAERVVAEYLTENDVQPVIVAPGTYYAYFAGEYEEFGACFRSPDATIPAAIEPAFVLSPRRLTLEDAETPGEPAPGRAP